MPHDIGERFHDNKDKNIFIQDGYRKSKLGKTKEHKNYTLQCDRTKST